ncbi:MAG: hypothetical protein JSS76_04190 [Bacteroidetes bacterium]|nr:hypothetical protein [Bacteroidota bacterium]
MKNKYGTGKIMLARGMDMGNVKRNHDVKAEAQKNVNEERSQQRKE